MVALAEARVRACSRATALGSLLEKSCLENRRKRPTHRSTALEICWWPSRPVSFNTDVLICIAKIDRACRSVPFNTDPWSPVRDHFGDQNVRSTLAGFNLCGEVPNASERGGPSTSEKKQSLVPHLSRQRQFVEFGTGFAPSRVMFLKNGDEAIAVHRARTRARGLRH
jgi:hypothetical protein